MRSLFQIVNERCPEFEPGKFFRVTLVFNKMLQRYVMESFVVPGEEKAPRLKTRINAGCQLLDVPMAQLHEVCIVARGCIKRSISFQYSVQLKRANTPGAYRSDQLRNCRIADPNGVLAEASQDTDKTIIGAWIVRADQEGVDFTVTERQAELDA